MARSVSAFPQAVNMPDCLYISAYGGLPVHLADKTEAVFSMAHPGCDTAGKA
ncbi:MAG: hypothetical protein KGL01_02475 [Betaproteobacteria bacterium]|nr:hypothetical protein [Betaproteobacteria bacterium]